MIACTLTDHLPIARLARRREHFLGRIVIAIPLQWAVSSPANPTLSEECVWSDGPHLHDGLLHLCVERGVVFRLQPNVQRELEQLAIFRQHLEQLRPVAEHPAPPLLRCCRRVVKPWVTRCPETARFDVACTTILLFQLYENGPGFVLLIC
jgi:hypothetical protein